MAVAGKSVFQCLITKSEGGCMGGGDQKRAKIKSNKEFVSDEIIINNKEMEKKKNKQTNLSLIRITLTPRHTRYRFFVFLRCI